MSVLSDAVRAWAESNDGELNAAQVRELLRYLDREAERETDTTWLCLGHPGWPSGMSWWTEEQAQRWWDQHGHRPGVWIVRVDTVRSTWRDNRPGVAPIVVDQRAYRGGAR